MPLLELLGRTAAATFLVVGTLAASHSIAARIFPASRFLLRWLGTVVAGMALATLGFHFLGAFGVFTLPGALAGCAALLGVTLGPPGELARWRRSLAWDRVALRRVRRVFARSPRRGWVYAFFVVSSTVILRPFVLPPLGFDSLVYHSTKAAMWVHEGGLRFLDGFNSQAIFRNYPAGAEVFSAWGMLPFHSDFLAVAPEAIQWLALILAGYVMARELGLRDPYAGIAAGLLAAMPPARVLVGSGYVEPCIGLLWAASMAFFARALRRGEAGALVFAAAGLGLAAGTKIPTLVLSVVAALVLLLRALFTARTRGLVAAVVVFVALGSPWYVYNVIDTGRPLSPLPIEVAGVKLGETNGSFELVKKIRPEWVKPYDWDAEYAKFDLLFMSDATVHEALGPPWLVIFGVFFLSLPYALWKRWQVFGPLALLVLANLAEVYSPQFAQVRMVWPETVARFLMPAAVIAAPMSLLWCARWPRLGKVWGAGAAFIVFRDLVRLVHQHASPIDLHAQGILAIFLVLVGLAFVVLRRARWLGAAAAGVAAVVWLHGWRYDNRYPLFMQATIIGVTPRSWISMARVVDDDQLSYRVAITGNPFGKQSWYVFGFYGTRLQNDVFYVPVTRDGSLAHDDIGKVGDRQAWLARLDASRPDFLVCVNDGALECRWARELPQRFQPMYVERGGAGVYRLK